MRGVECVEFSYKCNFDGKCVKLFVFLTGN